MSNTKTIQRIIKIFRVFSIVCIVFCAVGIAYSITALAITLIHHFLPAAAENRVFSAIAEYVGHGEFEHSLAFLLSCLISFIGDGYLHRAFHHYLDHELEEGTPFTTEGARLIFISGIKTIIIAPIVMIINRLIHLALGVTFTEIFTLSPNIEFGLALILLSKVFLAGCELIQKHKEGTERIEALERENSALSLEMQRRTSPQEESQSQQKNTQRFGFLSIFTKSKKRNK